jgi:hypothetical protein
MTSRIIIPKISKVNKMANNSFKDLVGKRVTKNTKFMGSDATIAKLSVSEVLEIQEKAKILGDDETGGLELLRLVIRLAVTGAEELTDEDFATFPMEELSKLSAEIMKYSGMVQAEQGK